MKSENLASRVNSFFVTAFGLLGLWASFMLLNSELKLLKDPAGELGCDFNPLVACSTSLIAPESSLFGPPNSIIGLIFFTVFVTLGVFLMSRVQFPRWIWIGWLTGSVAGVAYVIYFACLSVFRFKTLCPYCMLIWLSFLGIAVIAWCEAAYVGVLGEKAVGLGQSVRRLWWLVLIAIVLLLFLFVFVGLRDKFAMVL